MIDILKNHTLVLNSHHCQFVLKKFKEVTLENEKYEYRKVSIFTNGPHSFAF